MTRAELLTFVDEQRASQGPDGSYDLKDSHNFVYNALSKELYVGNVYLRVYNDQPDFEISEPEAFCVALIDFVSSIVHSQWGTESLSQNKLDLEGSSHDSVQLPTDGTVSENGQDGPEDSLVAPDGKLTSKDQSQLIKNLQFGLTSLQVYQLSLWSVCFSCVFIEF